MYILYSTLGTRTFSVLYRILYTLSYGERKEDSI